jgi:hypothetical protein
MRRMAAFCFLILVALICLLPGHAQTPRRPALQIVTPSLPAPAAGEKYEVELRAIGGRPPYKWSLPEAQLPAGLALDPISGRITGVPGSSDEFSVLVQVSDSGDPPLRHSKLLVAAQGAPLTVRWTLRPHIDGANIVGAVRVSNGSHDIVDTSVIVMAVNEYGRATALRYERLNLAPGKETPDLKFEVALPAGQYVAHVDAIGEVPPKKAIYRDRHEAGGLIVK